MKLTRIPGVERIIKHSFGLKASTSLLLHKYHELYCKQMDLDPSKVPLKDVAEQMLLDFMAQDKEFQKAQSALPRQSKKDAERPTAAAAPALSNPSQGSGTSSITS